MSTPRDTLKMMASVCAAGILSGGAPAWAPGEELELEWEELVALRAVRMARGISKAVDLQALHESIAASASEDPAIPEPDGPWNLQMLIDRLSKCDQGATITVGGGLSPGSLGSLRSASPGNVAFFGFDRGRVSVRSALASAEIMASAAALGGLPEDALVFYTQGVELNIGVVGLHVEANGVVTIQTKDFG